MQVIKGTEGEIPSALTGSFITIGNFDGVHLGHRDIFKTLIGQACRANRKAMLITFVPHPKMILHPDRRPFYLLTTLEEKLALLEEQGLDAVILIPFTLEYAKTTAESFIIDFLWGKLRAGKIFIGHDYTFGKNKMGSEEVLAAYGKKLGFDVEVIPAFTVGDTIISSSKIREAILRGDVKTAAILLGRPYNLKGEIVKGMGRGVKLGFPTANIKADKELFPVDGVYAALVTLEGKSYQAVLNIGMNPTFGDILRSLEVHLLDYDGGSIYGKSLEIFFMDRVREERRFAGPEELIAQIKKDVTAARTILQPYLP